MGPKKNEVAVVRTGLALNVLAVVLLFLPFNLIIIVFRLYTALYYNAAPQNCKANVSATTSN